MRLHISLPLVFALTPNLACRTQYLAIEQDESASTTSVVASTSTSSVTSTTTTSAGSTSDAEGGISETFSIAGTTGPESPDTTSSSSSSTSDDMATSSPDVSSSSEVPICGDGVVDSNEQCEGGADCDPNCQFFCGNGVVDEEREETCEPFQNAACNPITCTFCGDGIVNGFNEECDQGDMNGTQIPPYGKAECTTECTIGVLRAFVTSTAYSGDLGGISGANKKCKEQAQDAGLRNPDRFIAWLAGNDGYTALKELSKSCSLPYFRTDDILIAESAAELLTNPIADQLLFLGISESGNLVEYKDVWSCINSTGTSACKAASRCADWTSSDAKLVTRTGLTSFVGLDFCLLGAVSWTECRDTPCNSPSHLYCFEQCPP